MLQEDWAPTSFRLFSQIACWAYLVSECNAVAEVLGKAEVSSELMEERVSDFLQPSVVTE
jgi:hypothetical protein